MVNVVEAQGTASIRVNYQGGGNVSVASRFITVPIMADTMPEPLAETFRLRLFDPLGTSITPIGLREAHIHDGPSGRVFQDGFDGNGCP